MFAFVIHVGLCNAWLLYWRNEEAKTLDHIEFCLRFKTYANSAPIAVNRPRTGECLTTWASSKWFIKAFVNQKQKTGQLFPMQHILLNVALMVRSKCMKSARNIFIQNIKSSFIILVLFLLFFAWFEQKRVNLKLDSLHLTFTLISTLACL